MKYRKKPVEVEAMQYTGDNIEKVSVYFGDAFWICLTGGVSAINIIGDFPTPLQTGDWLVKEPGKRVRVFAPDIFEQTYEPVEDEPCPPQPAGRSDQPKP